MGRGKKNKETCDIFYLPKDFKYSQTEIHLLDEPLRASALTEISDTLRNPAKGTVKREDVIL